jgi:hypothetical protein
MKEEEEGGGKEVVFVVLSSPIFSDPRRCLSTGMGRTV